MGISQQSQLKFKMHLRAFRALSAKCAKLNVNSNRCISVFKPLCISSSVKKHKFFEPDYLDLTSHLPDVYPLVNIQLKGYNFDILESWTTASETFLAKTYDPNSTIVRDSCKIDVYERNVQVTNMRSIDAPILIDILRRTIPEGVELNVHPHQEEHYEARFIPDPFINGIKKELSEMEARHKADVETSQLLKAEKEAKKAEKKLSQLYEDEEDDDDEDD